MKRTLCLIAVLVIGYFLMRENDSPPTEKNIFHSNAFVDYFKAQGYSSFEDPMQLNQEYIQQVRKDLNPEAVRKMFTGADLTCGYQKFLNENAPLFEGGDYFSYLKESLKALKGFKKSKTTLSDDSYSEGNLPFLQFTLPGGTEVIRMGLPMMEVPYIQSLIFAPSVNPEFLAFIRQQKRHLYVNLMKREGLEAPYTFALESLENREPSFVAVTLDKNSDFYWQVGEYPEEIEAFKGEFYKKMTDPKGAYYWSKHLKDFNLRTILDTVHQKYFQKSELSKQERQDFIELTYLDILDGLAALLQPDSMNITCKHAIDRGPSLGVLWQLKLGLANENQAAALLLAPPLLMHNRTGHESRLDRFISAANYFYPKK